MIQLVTAIDLILHPTHSGAVGNEAFVSIVFFLVAIDRAWALIGAQDSGLLSVFSGLALQRHQAARRPGTARDAPSPSGSIPFSRRPSVRSERPAPHPGRTGTLRGRGAVRPDAVGPAARSLT